MYTTTRKIDIVAERGGNIIPTEQIFGDDSEMVSQLCMEIFHDALYHDSRTHTGCYRSDSRPKIADFEKVPGWIHTFKNANRNWEMNNPDEFQKERASQDAWTATAKNRFAKLFRLAKKHHVRLQWCGTSPYYTPAVTEEKRGPNCPDRWIIIQNTERIAHIYCM